jgi:hypothetical protein
MTIFGKKTLLLLGMLLAQQLAMLTAAWAADPAPAVKPQKTFDQCLMPGRLTFKDGAKGCIENYPGLMTSSAKSRYLHPFWDLGTTRPKEQCPVAVSAPLFFNYAATQTSAIQRCEDKIKNSSYGGVGCNCDSVFSIAKTLTRDQFEQYAKDFLPTGSGRITGFSTTTVVADSAAAMPNAVLAQTPAASAQVNSSQESRQQIEAERAQAQIKLEEERKRQEIAKAEETRRQQEQQRLAEERRQQEAAAKLAAEREAARVAAEGARQKELEVAALSAEVARLREQLLKSQAQPATQAANRKALVIGNDQYKAVPKLVNARSDAKLLADRLQSFGYSVTLKYDLTERDMKSTLRMFKSQVSPGDEVAIFFAGHGVQLGSANYLLPVDVAGESEDQIRDEAIPLQRILDDMTERKAKLTLALVDACRDNPFKTAGRSIGSSTRGLAPTSAATGQMVVYSAGTGQQALDKVGANDKTPNGLFMRVFAKEVDKSGVTIDAIVRTVRNEVARLARTVGHEQVPAIYDQVEGEFYLKR